MPDRIQKLFDAFKLYVGDITTRDQNHRYTIVLWDDGSGYINRSTAFVGIQQNDSVMDWPDPFVGEKLILETIAKIRTAKQQSKASIAELKADSKYVLEVSVGPDKTKVIDGIHGLHSAVEMLKLSVRGQLAYRVRTRAEAPYATRSWTLKQGDIVIGTVTLHDHGNPIDPDNLLD